MDDQKLTGRFLEACVTGDKVSHRMHLRACGLVMRNADLLREVIKLDVHPAAKSKFLKQWVKVMVWQECRERIADDDLWFAALRKLLPAYDGPAVQLFRGQKFGEPPGMSWTRSWRIADSFAKYGTAYEPHIKRMDYQLQRSGIVVFAEMQSEIICAPCLLGHHEGEFIVDPRTVVSAADTPR